MAGNEMKRTPNEAEDVGLRRILMAVLNKSWLVALVAVLCAAIVFAYTFFLVTPMYQAGTKFYVNNKDSSSGNSSNNMSSSDLTASRYLVDSYIGILETRETLNDVIDYAGIKLNYKKLLKMISAEAVGNTEIFQVTVESSNPKQAEELANAIAFILPQRISAIIEGTSVKIVEAATLPTSPSSPSYVNNTILGFILGAVLAVAFVVIKELTDTTIRKEEDISQVCRYPVLASIPDMNASGKGGYYAYSKGKGKDAPKNANKQPILIGDGISFAASEAYKLLRTKLQFSFAGDRSSRVIGVSSALSGEGKSLSSVNLAYTLSELGKKVILIDCDMRRPTLAEKLNIQKAPGLSSYLTGQSDLSSLVQWCGSQAGEKSFRVITAGQNPPNPSELLSSERMREGLRILRQEYDYVILDLPPVGEVSDAMTVTGETDGILLVVRENYCDRLVLADTVRQFECIEAKILGVVVNCANENVGKYGKSYYKKYYNRYYTRPYELANQGKRSPNEGK